MKKIFLLISFLLLVQCICAQNRQTDSLKKLISGAKDDTTSFNILTSVGLENLFSYPDTALVYSQDALLLAKKLKEPRKEAEALFLCGTALSVTGNYPLAIDYLLKGSHIEEQYKSLRITKVSFGGSLLKIFYYNLLEAYNDQGDYEHAIYYFNKS